MARARKSVVTTDAPASSEAPVRSSGMGMSIPSATLKRALTVIKSIPDRKSALPILARVLLVVRSESEAELLATDLNVTMRITLPISGGSAGGIVLEHKALLDLVKRLPGKTTTIALSERTGVTVKSDQIVAMLDGMSDRDFPKVPDHREIESRIVAAHTLAEAFKRTESTVCLDETRVQICGVKLEADGDTIRAISTDGHRLAVTETPFEGAELLLPGKGALIPRKGCAEIRKMLQAGGCRAGIHGMRIYVTQGNVTITSKLIDIEFPAWRQVVPSDVRHPIMVNRKSLIGALERASVLCTDTRGVKLTSGEFGLGIEASDPDKGTCNERIEATYAGMELSIGLNPSYLIDALASIATDEVALAIGKPLDPILVKAFNGPIDEKHFVVVMPMRI